MRLSRQSVWVVQSKCKVSLLLYVKNKVSHSIKKTLSGLKTISGPKKKQKPWKKR